MVLVAVLCSGRHFLLTTTFVCLQAFVRSVVGTAAQAKKARRAQPEAKSNWEKLRNSGKADQETPDTAAQAERLAALEKKKQAQRLKKKSKKKARRGSSGTPKAS